MAKEKLEKLEELLKCPVCLDTFREARILPCSHEYCQACLEKLGQGGSLTCPTCRQEFPVPAKGVAGFQAAYRINELKEIFGLEIGRTKNRSEVVCCDSPCPQHKDMVLELYCNSCDKLICFRCAYRGGKHHTHKHDHLKAAFQEFMGEVAAKTG